MTRRSLRIWWNAKRAAPAETSTLDCTLTACGVGRGATVLGVACPELEAHRLRTLGVYEGARVLVVDRRSGVLLEVCGTRLALNTATAAAIIVRPVAT